MNFRNSRKDNNQTLETDDSEADSMPESKVVAKSSATFSGRIFLENLKRVSKNYSHRSSRKSNLEDNLPTSHRPQNILAALILTVGIAMIAFDIPTYPWIAKLPIEYKWFFGAITDVGKSHWILFSTGIFMLTVLAIDWSNLMFRTRMTLYILWTYAGFIFFTVAISGIFALVLKWSLGRARPSQYAEYGAVHFDMFHFSYAFTSFPSGHSTTIAALGTALCLLFPSWLWFIVVIGFWLVISRIMVSAHYPSDVIAGTLLGITVTLWTARFLATRRLGFKIVPNKGVRRFAGNFSSSVCFRKIVGGCKKALIGSKKHKVGSNSPVVQKNENSESVDKTKESES